MPGADVVFFPVMMPQSLDYIASSYNTLQNLQHRTADFYNAILNVQRPVATSCNTILNIQRPIVTFCNTILKLQRPIVTSYNGILKIQTPVVTFCNSILKVQSPVAISCNMNLIRIVRNASIAVPTPSRVPPLPDISGGLLPACHCESQCAAGMGEGSCYLKYSILNPQSSIPACHSN